MVGTTSVARPKIAAAQKRVAIEAIRLNGVPRAHAAALAGIHRITFWRWMEDEDDATFRNAVEKAEAEWAEPLLRKIREAAHHTTNGGADQWQAAAWLLERRIPTQFRRSDVTEVHGPGGGPLKVEHGFTDEQRRERLAAVAAILQEAGIQLTPEKQHTNGVTAGVGTPNSN